MVKKVFISVGMRGRKEHDVWADIYRARNEVKNVFGADTVAIDNYNCDGPADAGRLWYLGEAIKKLGDCEACYFVRGWQKHKGCVAEMEVCKIYGIKVIEEV